MNIGLFGHVPTSCRSLPARWQWLLRTCSASLGSDFRQVPVSLARLPGLNTSFRAPEAMSSNSLATGMGCWGSIHLSSISKMIRRKFPKQACSQTERAPCGARRNILKQIFHGEAPHGHAVPPCISLKKMARTQGPQPLRTSHITAAGLQGTGSPVSAVVSFIGPRA